MQDAWVRAVDTLDAWRNGQAFGAWLRAITAHVAIDRLRRERRIAFESDVELQVPEASPEVIDLETAISSLAPGYRVVLVMHVIEGFTHEEIADRLDITVGTSKAQLFKARRALRARLVANATGRSK